MTSGDVRSHGGSGGSRDRGGKSPRVSPRVSPRGIRNGHGDGSSDGSSDGEDGDGSGGGRGGGMDGGEDCQSVGADGWLRLCSLVYSIEPALDLEEDGDGYRDRRPTSVEGVELASARRARARARGGSGLAGGARDGGVLVRYIQRRGSPLREEMRVLRARRVVYSAPLFTSKHVIQDFSPDWLQHFKYAPWLVANLHLTEPPDDERRCDNVIYRSSGLGYTVATVALNSGEVEAAPIVPSYLPLPAPFPPHQVNSTQLNSTHVTSTHVTSRHVTSRHVTSRHVTSPFIGASAMAHLAD